MLFWQVPAPNEALLISGSRRKAQDTQFRIVTGHGSFVLPVKQKARILSLSLREAEVVEECITTQGIRLKIRAIAAFKIGDDPVSIANAARRFLSEQDRMEELVGRIFAGHLRSIIGSLTVEEIIRERDRLAQEVKDGSHGEMEKLGIVVDSLQIQEIEDSTGYINNIAAPHAAAVASQARIAAAKADQEATQREQEAAALRAQYVRDTEIKQAGFAAETEEAKARAAQAGPLAQAKATQEVITEQTQLAERTAQLTEKQLESEVRRPADAAAYKQRTLAEADRDTTKLSTEAEAFKQRTLAEAGRVTTKLNTEAEANRRRTLAEAEADALKVQAAADAEAKKAHADGDAYAQRAVAAAEAEAINVRADALTGGNQALIAANKLIDVLPALVDAAAKGIAGSHLTVLSGTEGVNQAVAGVVGQGLSIYEALRRSLGTIDPASPDGHGHVDSAHPDGASGSTPARSGREVSGASSPPSLASKSSSDDAPKK
ncbi:MAG TPA: SPFH domain-containing protein [Mycobacteriales bacterium]|nr:SPFH domain-containing protein [Mycobacteriales bacterium]